MIKLKQAKLYRTRSYMALRNIDHLVFKAINKKKESTFT